MRQICFHERSSIFFPMWALLYASRTLTQRGTELNSLFFVVHIPSYFFHPFHFQVLFSFLALAHKSTETEQCYQESASLLQGPIAIELLLLISFFFCTPALAKHIPHFASFTPLLLIYSSVADWATAEIVKSVWSLIRMNILLDFPPPFSRPKPASSVKFNFLFVKPENTVFKLKTVIQWRLRHVWLLYENISFLLNW